MANEETAKQGEPFTNIRSEEFENLFANNVQYESTLWDLRMLFAQVELQTKQIVQHTGINIPWPQVKIAAYFMLANLLIHQNLNGSVFVPSSIAPPRPTPSDPKFDLIGPKPLVAYIGWVHDQIFGSNPYIAPEVAEELAREQANKNTEA
jgi:hypothetical protein